MQILIAILINLNFLYVFFDNLGEKFLDIVILLIKKPSPGWLEMYITGFGVTTSRIF